MILKLGSTGVAVRGLQAALEVPVDGLFGIHTAAALKAWQTSKGLEPDGIAGPKTLAVMFPAPAGDWVDLAPAFKDCSPRHTPPSMIVVHHSETTSANSTVQILRGRGLSTHFEVEADGTVRRYLDPAVAVAWHCGGGVNARSIGIDVTHHGKGADFPEVQVQALAKLVKGLCAQFGIPLVVAPDGVLYPRDSHNRVQLPDGVGVFRHRNLAPTICPAGLPLEQVAL